MFFLIAFGSLIRDHEHNTLTGATYLVLSSLLCITLFSKTVAVAAISFLVLGDTMAALVGRSFGKKRFFQKSIEGSLACFFSCLLCGSLVPQLSFGVSVVGALVATLVELLPLPIDDNLRIPLLSGGVMQLLS